MDNDYSSEKEIIDNIKNIEQQLLQIKSLYKSFPIKKNDVIDEIKSIGKNEMILNKITNKIENDILHTDMVEENKEIDVIGEIKDNNILLISEKKEKVFLPYKISDLKAYINEYPEEYNSLSDVINQEYIISMSRFKNPKISRFREMYELMRDIEMKSVIESFKKAFEVMFNSQINPAVIAACKSERQFNTYLYCVKYNHLEDFDEFKIVFDVMPFEDKYSRVENHARRKGKH